MDCAGRRRREPKAPVQDARLATLRRRTLGGERFRWSVLRSRREFPVGGSSIRGFAPEWDEVRFRVGASPWGPGFGAGQCRDHGAIPARGVAQAQATPRAGAIPGLRFRSGVDPWCPSTVPRTLRGVDRAVLECWARGQGTRSSTGLRVVVDPLLGASATPGLGAGRWLDCLPRL